MPPDSKKPTAAFWITVVLVAVLVGYPLSFGPACWISSRTTFAQRTVETFYRPIVNLWMTGPESVADFLNWYCYVGAERGWIWSRPRHLNWSGPQAPRIVPQNLSRRATGQWLRHLRTPPRQRGSATDIRDFPDSRMLSRSTDSA